MIIPAKSQFNCETAEQKSAKLARNVHWMILYQICVFGADLKSNMAARVNNVFSMAEILKIFLSEATKPIELKKRDPKNI
jgi:hypothetical protein